ncbi:MAG: hypothetical protein CMJ91_01540 [Planctomycetes bacterium]|mgnify:FL=1|nr:hypothetical protein [Planctomycetota bacterium]
MIALQERYSFCPRLPAAIALLLLSSCGSPSGGEAPRAQSEPFDGGRPEGQSFLRIGNRSITEVARAESFIASRCLFYDDGFLTHITLAASLREAPQGVQDELSALLADLQRRRTGTGGDPAPPAIEAGASRGRRIYQLHPTNDWIIDLSLDEFPGVPATVRVVCKLRIKGEKNLVADARAPLLLKYLREKTAEGLLAQMDRPRVPLDRHFQALAGFLGTGALSESELKRARRLLIAKAGKNPAIAATLLDHLDSFDPSDLAALDSDGSIAPRVFYLAWSANRGLKKPLGELLVLSLEYHGDAVLFQRALTALFPRKKNKRLYALHPPGRDREGALAFIRSLREMLARVEYQGGKGWTVEP